MWPAALVLCTYLSSHPECLGNKSVLEIGAGLGIPVGSRLHRKLTCLLIKDYVVFLQLITAKAQCLQTTTLMCCGYWMKM